jgi:hypothetical protein
VRANFFRDRTACGRGHAYTEKSTHRFTFQDVYGLTIHRRRCRICEAENARVRRAKASKKRSPSS